jgi:PAS domain-containing protein
MGGKHVGDTIMTGESGNAATSTNADSEELTQEEKTIHSDEKFRSVFESTRDCLILLGSSGRIIDVNERTVDTFGGSKEELLGKHFAKLSVFSPNDIPRLLTAFARAPPKEERQ